MSSHQKKTIISDQDVKLVIRAVEREKIVKLRVFFKTRGREKF